MSDYIKLPRDIADCMKRAGAELSEDQYMLLAGYLAQTQSDLTAAKAEIERLRGRVADQHEQLLEIHGVTSSISEVDIQPADYSETLTVRRVKKMAMLINQMSGWIDETKRKVSDLEIISQKGDDKVFQKFSALILRKQAEAVDAWLNGNAEMGELTDYAQSLRQQADELDND